MRTCSTGAITAKVTSEASSIKKVSIAVKGQTPKTATFPAAGAAITVPAGVKAAPTVTVSVTLKSGGVKTGSRAYLACTA